jgi:hypothetical protein
MFTADLFEYKTKQNELFRQAEYYRLVKAFRHTNPLVSRIVGAIGRMLIQTGQLLLSRTQPAQISHSL